MRQRPVPDSRVVEERREDNRRFLQVRVLDALGGVDVGVVGPDVVVRVVLDGVEAEHPRADEAEVIRAADPLHHVLSRAEIADMITRTNIFRGWTKGCPISSEENAI